MPASRVRSIRLTYRAFEYILAIGAYAAATVAKSDPMKTGLEAMRLGSIIYFVPFFFVLNPALIGIGTAYEVMVTFGSALFGIVLISAGLQGYLYGVGATANSTLGWVGRALLAVGGIILALPGNSPLIGYSHLELNSAAIGIALLGAVACRMALRQGPAPVVRASAG